jgi:acid phosphatase
MNILISRYFLVALLCVGMCGCTTLPNLTLEKNKYYKYHDSGKYERDLESVTIKATRYAQRRVKATGEKMAIVFDIDDTALSNWDYMSKIDLGYGDKDYENWILKGDAIAIKPTLKFYNEVQKLNFSIFFVTGRREHLKNITISNLRAAGYANWAGLYLRPETDKSVSAFKTEIRSEIEREGFHIIINIGDQYSDLVGGYAEREYKLPNPFYQTN